MALQLDIPSGNGGAAFHPNSNPGIWFPVRNHLDQVLDSLVIASADIKSGRLEASPNSNTYELVDFREQDIEIRSLILVSDARAQAQMPAGIEADSEAYLGFLIDAGMRLAKQTGGSNGLKTGIFMSDRPRAKDVRRKTHRAVRAEVSEPGGGIDYAARLAIGEIRHPEIELPTIQNLDVVEAILAKYPGVSIR